MLIWVRHELVVARDGVQLLQLPDIFNFRLERLVLRIRLLCESPKRGKLLYGVVLPLPIAFVLEFFDDNG